MKITTYNDITIEILRKTERPCDLVCMAARQTQVMVPSDVVMKDNAALIEYLVEAEHHSPLEHASITLRIVGCSRSLLAQITRQRTFKFTSSSQHYQNSSDYPCVVHPDLVKDDWIKNHLDNSFSIAYNTYLDLLNEGIPKEEVRQVLPNAAAVNLVVTMDARNLMYFLRQRRCERNVTEMKYVADGFQQIGKAWFPELFNLVGPPCVMDSKCKQGKMMAEVCHGPRE